MKSGKGQAESFVALCQSEYATVFRSAYALTRDRELAADATQEAFSRAFARWKRLQSSPWVAGWITTTALNYCRRQMRSRTRGVSTEQVDGHSSDVAESHLDLHEALARLPMRQRQVVILHYANDLSVRVTAELLQISEGTVKAHLFRARESMLRFLASNDESEAMK